MHADDPETTDDPSTAPTGYYPGSRAAQAAHSPAKPYADDLGELPQPIAGHGDRPASRLSNLLWLSIGVIASAATLGSPGCVAMGGPAVSAKADVSVKETMLVAQNGSAGQGGHGELTANVSFTVAWPGKGK